VEIARNFEKHPGKSISTILEKSFVDVDDSITGPLQQSFKSSISWTKTKARKQKAVDDLLEQNGTLVELALRARGGSTALVTVISPNNIHVANVGDCRAGERIFNGMKLDDNHSLRSYSRTVLGQINDKTGRLEAVALTSDQDGHNQAEYMRVLSEHPVKEHKDIFAGGRLFGETPVTRCKHLNFRLKALR
jgi:serine/threonine protein phosphatase PrpC